MGFGAFEVRQFEDLRQSDGWSEYITRLGWRVINPKIYVRKLPIVGAVMKIQRPRVVPPVGEIDEIAKKHRALFVKLEPPFATPLRQGFEGQAASGGLRPSSLSGFEPDTWTLLPTRTIHLDLTPSEEEIFKNFSKDARYSVRKSRRSEVNIDQGDKIETFYKLLKETGGRKKFYVAPFKHLRAKAEAFKNKSALILAYHNKEVTAGALILFHDRVAYYHHAASNPRGRDLLAAYLIVWEAIKLAKKRGCHTFDLEGIYDQRYKVCRRLKTLSVFKRKFGGEEITFPGSFVRYYNPLVRVAFKVGSVLS